MQRATKYRDRAFVAQWAGLWRNVVRHRNVIRMRDTCQIAGNIQV
jgi:hypothetical protein